MTIEQRQGINVKAYTVNGEGISRGQTTITKTVADILRKPENNKGFLLSPQTLRMAREEVQSPNRNLQDSLDTLAIHKELPDHQQEAVERGRLQVGFFPPTEEEGEIIVQFHSLRNDENS